MNISRRSVLKIAGMGALLISFVPRVAFAARGQLKSLRTGVQPGNKTRLVIETSTRPSYNLSYYENRLVVSLANTTGNLYINPKMVPGTLVKSLTQSQAGDRLLITANLSKSISEIPRNQILLLQPNGDNGYRLVLDFVAGKSAVVASNSEVVKQQTQSAKKYVIVIDPGHGGKDPGCIGRHGSKEKHVVLAVGRKLKTKLDAAGFNARLTRSTDVFLNLDTRANLAEKYHADLFISLHANSNPSRSMQGFSIYTLSKKASDQEAQKLAEAENASDKIDVDGFEKFSVDVRNALSALQQQAVAEMSVEYAANCADDLQDAGVKKQCGSAVRHAAFAVLRSTIPGALIELGHLTNDVEERLLTSDSYQDKLASTVLKSIKEYNFEV
ncbi:MAG TPA: N-acetylmuramoyl-L-alanine amidase [Alphaproteobacteria bacterium]|nr:N-acetylmuramoyl-L-alanine amidase [Alphaproteobacteria bacterium]